MGYFKAAIGFAIGALAIIAIIMAIEVFLGGYTYRNTRPAGNFIFGVLIFSPFVLCGALGFALGLKLIGAATRHAQAALLGAGIVPAIGVLHWLVNRVIVFNPFQSTLEFVALVFIVSGLWGLLPALITSPAKLTEPSERTIAS